MVLTVTDKFVLLTVQVHALDQPGRKSVGTFRDTCANKIRRGGSDDVEFLNAGPDEWIRIITMDKLEHWIHNIHEYRLGRVILVCEGPCYATATNTIPVRDLSGGGRVKTKITRTSTSTIVCFTSCCRACSTPSSPHLLVFPLSSRLLGSQQRLERSSHTLRAFLASASLPKPSFLV